MAFHIARNSEQLGVFEEDETRRRLAAGEFQPSDLCWQEGMTEWRPLGEVIGRADAVPPAPQNSEINPYAAPVAELRRADTSTQAPLATLGQRFLGALLDGVTFLVGYIPFIVGALMMTTPEMTSPETGDASEYSAVPAIPVFSLVFMAIGGALMLALLVINLILLAKRGQTIGKRIIGTRIVDVNSDDHPGFVQVFVLRYFVNGLLGMIPLYAIVDVLFIFGEQRRCIHDYLAKTRVVQGQPV